MRPASSVARSMAAAGRTSPKKTTSGFSTVPHDRQCGMPSSTSASTSSSPCARPQARAAGRADRAVHLDDVSAARALVQAVDVLGHDGVDEPRGARARERAVALVRLGGRQHPVALAVKLPDLLGVAAERVDRAVLERVELRPDPVGVRKSGMPLSVETPAPVRTTQDPLSRSASASRVDRHRPPAWPSPRPSEPPTSDSPRSRIIWPTPKLYGVVGAGRRRGRAPRARAACSQRPGSSATLRPPARGSARGRAPTAGRGRARRPRPRPAGAPAPASRRPYSERGRAAVVQQHPRDDRVERAPRRPQLVRVPLRLDEAGPTVVERDAGARAPRGRSRSPRRCSG